MDCLVELILKGIMACHNSEVFAHIFTHLKKLKTFKMGTTYRLSAIDRGNFEDFLFPLVGGDRIEKLSLVLVVSLFFLIL